MTELVVDDWNEYGGGGPEYMVDGLISGGAGMETGILG